MRIIDPDQIKSLPGRQLGAGDTFKFRCHKDLACFNKCCRNLNLFLYPYDVLRLKKQLDMDSDAFLDRYVDVVLRKGQQFPEVLLRMADCADRTCPFLTDAGCRVYPDRPDTCRTFPVEQGRLHDPATGRSQPVFFFRPPDFCLGRHEDDSWTTRSWAQDQDARRYHQMTADWAELRSLFEQHPWGTDGPMGPAGKMAFMATYNVDAFRRFVFGSSFLKRYRVKPVMVKKLRSNDSDLLQFGFDWIKLYLWQMPSKKIRLRS